MPDRVVAPYGSWKSPITSDLIVAGTVALGQVMVDGDHVLWLEGRPSEGGRQVVVRLAVDGRAEDLHPPPFNARTRVHEYGGGSFLSWRGAPWFTNFADQRLYRWEASGEPQPLTEEASRRYADLRFDMRRNRLLCVLEDHTGGGEPVNSIAAVDAASGAVRVLVSGSDFYSSPRISPDGGRLAWLSWNHPNMPWHGCELWLAEIAADGGLTNGRRVAGGPAEAIFQPEWSPEGVLHFASDRNGWWNLYRWAGGDAEALLLMEAELGRPQWVFGMSTYGFLSGGRVLCAVNRLGSWGLGVLDQDGGFRELDTPHSEIAYLVTDPERDVAAWVGGSAHRLPEIVRLDVASGQVEVLKRSSELQIDPGHLSPAVPVEFPTGRGKTAHAFLYRPNNRDYRAPEGERPPLLVMIHGGPTSAAASTLNLRTQYWTSRGFAVADVNYGGSTGYGRDYRQRLDGRWGLVDVEDCVNVALYLAAQGEVDGERMAITGGSAGGYTTLAALTFHDTFKAGASHFGVTDLEALARDTHKFESRYLDGLVGPYPERRDLYLERSPIHHTDKLSCPVIFFQGLEDAIVPPVQAEAMVEALRRKGLPVAYLPFEGEQHGFRRAENIKRALDGEFYFYSRIFGFTPADDQEPVDIENL